MPRGELEELLNQLPEIMEIISAGTVEVSSEDDEDED